jgi:hypothetical protein
MAKKLQLNIELSSIIRLTTGIAMVIAGIVIFVTATFITTTLSQLSSVSSAPANGALRSEGVREDLLEKLIARQAARTTTIETPSTNLNNPFVSVPTPPPAPPVTPPAP